MTPALLTAGGLALALGQPERALGLLQFNPLHDWEPSMVNSRFSAIAILGIHGIHLNNPDALTGLSHIQHVVVSQSCLDRMGGIKTHEHFHAESGLNTSDLLRIPMRAVVRRVDIDDLKGQGAGCSQRWARDSDS